MIPTHTLADPRVEAALIRMFAHAAHDEATAARVRAEHGGFMPTTPIRPATVIEFGTSFGISTLHLAAAVRDNGAGRVITTELSRDKIAAARRTFTETGLDDVITVLEGDARETLSGIDGSADFVLLDGWKELCLPVLRLLEPHLQPGTLVVADDVALSSLQPYLSYVRTPANGYQSVTFPVEDGMEISCRL